MPIENCVVRTAKIREAEAIYAFYREMNDINVLPRPLTDLRESAEKGLFYVAETDTGLGAVSGVFDLGSIPFVELGGTIVDRPLRGFRLQQLLFRLRIASVLLNQGPQVGMVTAIDPLNQNSVRNAAASGFVGWNDPIPELFVPCMSCPKREVASSAGRRCCCDFCLLPKMNMRQEIKRLLEGVDGCGRIACSRSRTNETIVVNVQSRVLQPMGRGLLAEFVGEESW